MNSKQNHGELLEPGMRQLNEKLKLLKFDEELFKIIHFPGYTTPAEFFLVQKNVELLHGLVDVIQEQKKNITTASKKIISEVKETA